MNRRLVFASCISTLFLAQAAFACDYPQRPEAPNGSTASKEDMIAGQKAFNQYIKDLEAYQSCIVDEEKEKQATMADLTPELVQEREELLTKKYNAAHDEMLRAAAAFNAELKEYQSQGKQDD